MEGLNSEVRLRCASRTLLHALAALVHAASEMNEFVEGFFEDEMSAISS